MTTYTPIIRYLLLWQLLLPVLIVLTGIVWVWSVITGGLFSLLYAKSYCWESNSYSRYGSLAVAITSIVYAVVNLVIGSNIDLLSMIPLTQSKQPNLSMPWPVYASSIVWLFSMVAFTATSPYPLGIRMPVVVYTVFFLLLGPEVAKEASSWLVLAAVVFSFLMLYNLTIWRSQNINNNPPKSNSLGASLKLGNDTDSKILSSVTMPGPPEPPFSFSLATAIVLILVLALGAGLFGLCCNSHLLYVVPLLLVSGIIVWLLSSRDWQKNILAISALVLILVSNFTSIASFYIQNNLLRTLAYILMVAPVIFHTTAPVFRGMRITITLYAIYNAFCKSSIGLYLLLLYPDSPNLNTIVFIAVDGVVLFILILMALHWKRTQKDTKGHPTN